MTPPISRRDLLRSGAAGGLGIAIIGSVDAIAGPAAAQTAQAGLKAVGYGPVVADPAGLLALPRGFSYKIVAQAGKTLLETGEPTPSDADGTGFFRGRNGSVLVNNHEIGGNEPYPVPALPGLTYDPGARGGTTNIEVDGQGNRIREYVSVAGTHNNCAGGITPWSTWLTCEETEQRAGGVFQKNHGYVFEVDPFDRDANLDPVPLKFLGRFSHEAVAVDPHTSAIYETEDAGGPNGLYFRWTPPRHFRGGKGALRALALGEGGDTAGTLQAMSCFKGSRHIADLSEATQPGTRYRVEWIDVPDRDAATVSVRKQFADGQVTRSRKLEGAWWADGGAYFVSSYARTDDGSVNEHDGQVWFYDPRSETVTLRTIFGVNPDPEQDTDYDGPDNITVSPYGGIILAEDGEGLSHLVGVTKQGKAYPMARNELNDSEFTGPTFSADGRILFANIQSPGYVFAITGPWGRPGNGDGGQHG
ncbi:MULTISPECIES: alkaline phosphatase PhoX [Streptosporangium]|uniref:Secreted PhoX family phosphatase n=1 Tax=Streptosporangium brasiliense TaxID=47480 RepID=A0ABT9R5N2_9ACTN|nr:alkaline phosphatase PhoX [Streptosporangium brasiliense]MDP9864549.1 secreted PhoX family phosphatase [Streptosporangium brasiliense]